MCTIISDNTGIIANVNPFRYRSYYFDQEIGLYYLQSRYYDASVGRFINGDEVGMLQCFGAINAYNIFTYCNDDPINRIDCLGYKSTKTYSGVVGFGVQILLSANVLCYQGFIGAEALWFSYTKNNNFGNGKIPWCYWFAGGSMGLTLDFDLILSNSFLKNPKNVLKSFGLTFNLSIGVTFFLITANKLKNPNDYTREFGFTSFTTWGITISKASGSNISTYGVGFTWEVGTNFLKGISIGKKLFGLAQGASFYWALPINKNAKNLYSTVEKNI